MNEEEISAQEQAITKSLAHLEKAESLLLDIAEGGDYLDSADASTVDVHANMAKAWAETAVAISAHNESIIVLGLAKAAVEWIKNPSQENYSELGFYVEQYLAGD